MTDLNDLCARLFDAFVAHDLDAVEAMLAPGATLTQNGTKMTWDVARPAVAAISTALGGHRYTNVRRVIGEHAVVEEHDVVATAPNGDELRLFACVVVRVDDDGRITSMDEYADPTPLAALG